MKRSLLLLFLAFAGVAHGQKFSDFTAETSPAGTDHVVGYRTAGVAGGNRRFTLSTLNTYFSANLSLDWARITAGKPTTLAGYGITDALTSVTAASTYLTQATAASTYQPLVAAGTTGQYWRGDKSWQTLDKSAVGLGNVDNTSDAAKPISTATQTALDLKASLAAIAAVNASGVNTDGLIDWSQLVNVPAGFADGTDDGAGGGGGTVTSFSAGDLSPLFTTSEATATTTPALTFTLTNAAQNAVFAGPATGGTGAPAYRALVAADIPSAIATDAEVTSAVSAVTPTSLGLVIGTNVQAYDADLTTYAGITPAANTQTLLGSANYAAWRTNLGLVIGTNVQAYDADLDDLADGSLTGSKVGTGISGDNVTSGTVADARIDAAIARDSEVTSAVSGKANTAGGNTFTGTQTLDKIAWAAQNGSTVAGAGTLTLSGSYSVNFATFSGSTATIALPAASGSHTITVHGLSTYNSGTQTITVPSLIRPESDPDTATTSFTVPASTGAYWTAQFTCINGAWVKFSVVGDTLGQSSGSVSDTAYDATSWNGDTTTAPSKNAVRDKFETLIIGTHVQAYDADLTTWAGITPGSGVATALGNAVDASGGVASYARVANTQTSTHASPSTTTPLSPTWTGDVHTVWYGATGTINLPAAAGYTGRGILIYNTGAFTVTVDANGSEVIVRDGTAQTGGVSMTLSSGAGNYVALISDGARWVTVGYKGTLAAGS